MIPLWVAILLMFLGVIFGFLAAVICGTTSRAKEKILTIQQVDEATEEIIQEAINHAGCFHRAEGDADYEIDKIGTQKIRRILEGML